MADNACAAVRPYPLPKKCFFFALTKPLLAKERPHKSPGKIRRGGVSARTA